MTARKMVPTQSMFRSVTPNQTGLDIVKLSKEKKKPVVDITSDAIKIEPSSVVFYYCGWFDF